MVSICYVFVPLLHPNICSPPPPQYLFPSPTPIFVPLLHPNMLAEINFSLPYIQQLPTLSDSKHNFKLRACYVLLVFLGWCLHAILNAHFQQLNANFLAVFGVHSVSKWTAIDNFEMKLKFVLKTPKTWPFFSPNAIDGQDPKSDDA